ncbi:MAG TPA: hypothetical protein DD434_10300 [Bacteroidales bacterium]|nr:hypothetical protein [Bacteroidales bacterium]
MKGLFKPISFFTTLVLLFTFAVNVNAQVEVFDDNEPIFVVAEESPEFPGGDTALYNFIEENLRYPNTEADFQGKIILSFIVEKDGSLSNVKLIRGLYKPFDEEAIRVVKLMPKWKPAKQRGKTVRFQNVLPIKFQIK